jgi:hypothetical protein
MKFAVNNKIFINLNIGYDNANNLKSSNNNIQQLKLEESEYINPKYLSSLYFAVKTVTSAPYNCLILA